jgi:predicted metallopeptidase
VRKSIKSKNNKVEWKSAPDIKKRVNSLVDGLDETQFIKGRIFCFRSLNTHTRAIARIWGFSRIWQIALSQKPAYALEVISERFDHLPEREKDKILLHELAHIPSNFSGALVPHIRRGKRNFNDKVRRFILKSFS